MSGKVVLITGGSTGIGKETALSLAQMGAELILVSRDPVRGEAALEEVKKKSVGQPIHFWSADLSLQSEIHRIAALFKSQYQRLNVLVNNAGVIMGERKLTGDALEMTFALNHMAYFLLTDLLLDVLKATTPARVINVASDAQHMVRTINFDDLQFEESYSPWKVYGQSKLANVLFTYELARRLEGTGVTVNCMHPGVVATNFGSTSNSLTRFVFRLAQPFLLTGAQGADTIIYLASSPEVEGVTGKYFVKRRNAKSALASYDTAIAQRLWEVSEHLISKVSA